MRNKRRTNTFFSVSLKFPFLLGTLNFLLPFALISAITTLQKSLFLLNEVISMCNFDMVPSDIMLDICSRVPTKDVIECKLVSKRWKNLIQQPSFPKLHLNNLDSAHDSRSGKLSCLFYTLGFQKVPVYYSEFDENLNRFTRTTRINFKLPFENCKILGSCNGLICFNGSTENTILRYEPVYICNPIAREFIVLPKSEINSILTGFGYSSSTNEYKVVRVCNSGIVQAYTIGSGTGWRDVTEKDIDVRISQYGAFLDGAIHWADKDGTVHAFDLADEVFRELPSPVSPQYTGDPFPILIRVYALGNFLCAYHLHAASYEIWVLKKNKNDVIWSKEFSDLSLIIPINFTNSGGLLCYDLRDNNVYRYAPKASSSRMLVNFDKNLKFNTGVAHKNTLVSLKALGEVDTKSMDSESDGPSQTEQKEERNLTGC